MESGHADDDVHRVAPAATGSAPVSAVPHRGCVLLADFSDPVREHRNDEALSAHEIRTLVDRVQSEGGQTVEHQTRKLLAFHPRLDAPLNIARDILGLCARIRSQDPERHSLAARVLLGYGEVRIDGQRLWGDWTHQLGGAISHVPPHTIAALTNYAERLPAGAVDPPPRPLRPGVMLLQATDIGGVETQLASRLSDADRGLFTSLTIKLRGEVRTIAPGDCPVLIGRDASCALRITGPTASRIHGRIEYRQGRYYYVDDSRNGSYVLTGGGEELRVAQDRLVLAGSGAISPGAPIADQKGEVLRYSTQSQKLAMAGGPDEHDTRPLPSSRS